jgi:hypothetical protein
VVGLGVNVGDEPRADQEDFGSAHGVNLQPEAYYLQHQNGTRPTPALELIRSIIS